MDAEQLGRAYLGDCVAARWAAAEARQTDRMRAALPAAALEQVFRALEQAFGAFDAIASTSVARGPQDMQIVAARLRYARGECELHVTIDRDGRVAGLWRAPSPADVAQAAAWSPPSYVRRDAFDERDVEVGSNPALPGTLSIPKGEGPVPAAVLVHGSGPSDRDETIGGNKPFKDVAWGLASRGVAVLRYDKRTRVSPAGVVTVEQEVVDGARAAIALCLREPRIDAGRVVVVGHSQGGYLAPRIAREVPGVAAMAVLAAPTRPLEESLVAQLDYIASLGGPGAAEIEKLAAAARALRDRLRDPALRPEDEIVIPPGARVTGAYFLDLRDYRPQDVAASLGIPVFVAHGARDYQVADEELAEWRAALPNAEVHAYPALDHLFRAGQGKATPASYASPGHVDGAVVADLARWIAALG